jgi:hypothetical protein
MGVNDCLCKRISTVTYKLNTLSRSLYASLENPKCQINHLVHTGDRIEMQSSGHWCLGCTIQTIQVSNIENMKRVILVATYTFGLVF